MIDKYNFFFKNSTLKKTEKVHAFNIKKNHIVNKPDIII